MIVEGGYEVSGIPVSYCRDCWGIYDRTNQMDALCNLLSSTRSPVFLVTLLRQNTVLAEVSVALFGRTGPYIRPLSERQSTSCVMS